MTLHSGDPVVSTLTAVIRSGDVESLERLLAERPDLASARVGDDKGGSRTPLHLATDWPGHFPKLDIARNQGAEDLVEWLRGQGARSASELS